MQVQRAQGLTRRLECTELTQMFGKDVHMQNGACMQAGAKHVYGIERSAIAEQARQIVEDNRYQDRITIIQGKVEEVDLPVPQVRCSALSSTCETCMQRTQPEMAVTQARVTHSLRAGQVCRVKIAASRLHGDCSR